MINQATQAAMEFGATVCIIGGLLLAAVAYGAAVRGRRRWLAAQQHAQPDIKRDWLATGRINAVCTNPLAADDLAHEVAGDWLITVQEDRLVSDVSGDANVEIRWRKATKHEIKAIVAGYHQHLSNLGMGMTAEKRERSFFAAEAPNRDRSEDKK